MNSTHVLNCISRSHPGVTIDRSWIETQTLSSPEDLYRKWLVTDLAQTGSNSLPGHVMEGLSSKVAIQEPVTLQINSVINVGASMYSQLKKLEGKPIESSTQNTQATQYNREPPVHRMLFIEFTDGTNCVSGMEYRPIPQLSVNTLPGCKVLVFGAECRLGVMLLESANINILGGSVDELCKKNSQAVLLNEALNGDCECEDMEIVTTVTSSITTQSIPSHALPSTLNNPDHQFSQQTNLSAHNSNPLTNSNNNNNNNQSVGQPNIQNQPHRTMQSTPTVHRNQVPQTVPNTTDSKQNILRNIKIEPKSNDPEQSGFLNDFLSDCLDLMENDAVSSSEYNLRDLRHDMTFPVDVVATISTLTSRLTPIPEWTVNCVLSDYSSARDICLGEEFLIVLIGFSSQEFKELQPVSKTNDTVKSYLRKGLEQCQAKLKFMTGKFKLVLNKGEVYKAVDFSEVEEGRRNQLQEHVMSQLNTV